MTPHPQRPSDGDIDIMIEKLAMFMTHKCKSKRCVIIHQRMIDTLEWVLGRRNIP